MLVLSAHRAQSKLQRASERRAVVEFVLDAGGKASLKQINEHFNFDTRSIVLALNTAGWLDIV